MARVIETRRCTLDTRYGVINGWGVGVEADTYEEALALARNSIRPMVEEDVEQAIREDINEAEPPMREAENREALEFFRSLGL